MVVVGLTFERSAARAYPATLPALEYPFCRNAANIPASPMIISTRLSFSITQVAALYLALERS